MVDEKIVYINGQPRNWGKTRVGKYVRGALMLSLTAISGLYLTLGYLKDPQPIKVFKTGINSEPNTHHTNVFKYDSITSQLPNLIVSNDDSKENKAEKQ